jgi:hypothetical protein
MQKDFHYYAVYQLAKLAGFGSDDSETIAYASQYVDDATESEPIEPFPDQHFDTVRTAHYNLGAFDWNVQKKIYMPFHFLPTTIRWESPAGFSYCTIQAREDDNNLLSNKLIDDALLENNKRFRFIRLGVALHTITDTFSHFGFSGRHHNENDVDKIWLAKSGGSWKLKPFESHIVDMFVPMIGHVEASSYPDYPYLKWRYTNGKGKMRTRDNLKLSLNAINFIYKKLKVARDSSNKSSDLSQDHPDDYTRFKLILKQKGNLEKRIERWKNYTNATEYNKHKWRKAAIIGDVKWDNMSRSERKIHTRQLKGRANFDTSKWAYFHRAALKQRSLVLSWIN